MNSDCYRKGIYFINAVNIGSLLLKVEELTLRSLIPGHADTVRIFLAREEQAAVDPKQAAINMSLFIKFCRDSHLTITGSILSVESNQNVESKVKTVEPKT
jgi:hypothetical protein